MSATLIARRGPVLLAAALVGAASGQPEVERALDRAQPALRSQLAEAGGSVLALVALAGVHELGAAAPEVAAAVARLAALDLDDTYGLGLRLMVAAACGSYPDRSEAGRRDLRRLLANLGHQGFGYRDAGGGDLSNTQFGALGMRAAASLDLRLPEGAWQRLLDAAVRYQHRDGGFSYGLGSDFTTPSMTVAGIAVLEICGHHLEAARTRAVGRRLAAAWRWLDEHADAVGDLDRRHAPYFHYGLLRAAVLSDVGQVGGVDWYRAGCAALVAAQADGGTWTSPASGALAGSAPVATAFAVLFLRRAFDRRPRAAVTPPRDPVAGLGAQAAEDRIAAAVSAAVAAGKDAVPGLLRHLRLGTRPQREAAARALQGIAGREFGFAAGTDPADAPDAIRAVELWWLAAERDGRSP